MYDDLNAILKSNHASLTKARKSVFDALFNQKPISISQLTKKIGPKADRATIYRTLDLFEHLGIVHRLNIGWKHKYELSDIFHGHHHHFYCTGCDQTYSLPANSMLETMIGSVTAKEGFSPRGHQLEIYGLCVNCSKRRLAA